MITVDLALSGLPLRQKQSDDVDGVFALAADDGSILLDDEEQIMETYGDE